MPDRGTLYVQTIQIPLGKITSEAVDLQAGLWNKPLPTTSSDANIAASVFGKKRSITLQGKFSGSQAQIEAFLDNIEGWINRGGTSKQGLYYPLFHKDNTNAGTNEQSAYFAVICDSFQYTHDTSLSPSVIEYELNLVEGLAILEVTT